MIYQDLSKELNERTKEHILQFKYDKHFNEETNEFIEEIVTTKIKLLLENTI